VFGSSAASPAYNSSSRQQQLDSTWLQLRNLLIASARSLSEQPAQLAASVFHAACCQLME